MKEKRLTIMAYLLILLMPFAANALEVKTNTHTYGGSGNDSIKEMIATTDGGYAILVETDSIDIENVTFKGDEDGLIVKYDKDGNIAWQRVYGGTSRDRMYSITATNDGGVVIAGLAIATIATGGAAGGVAGSIFNDIF